MSRDTGSDRSVSRRKFLVTSGAVGSSALIAGCGSSGGETTDDSGNGNGGNGNGNGGNGNGGNGNGNGNGEDETTQNSGSITTLEADGSSTVYPVSNKASSYWNANRPADDTEYWPHDEYGIDTDKALADYWAGLYGFEPAEEGETPFNVTVALSHSGTGVRKVRDGKVDIGNSSGNVEDELPERDSYEQFVDHVTAVDGQPLVVSQEIADAGVEKITGQQLKDLYKGRITNWSELGGPDKEITVLGRAKDSGTRTSFVSNVFGDPKAETTVANRFGQNQRLAQAIGDSDSAISYLALAFINTQGLAPISLEWEGTTYTYGDDENGLDSKAYPLSRDLHMYTWEGTSKKEAAFIRMCLHPFGQDTFVKPNNYFALGERRRKEQLDKLPETTA